jgi:acetolactate synthase I/II/III large subunit
MFLMEGCREGRISSETTARIPESVRRGLTVATSGRPGPVVLDVAEDVAHGEHDFTETDFTISPEISNAPLRRTRADARDIDAAADLLRRAKRPMILVGGGIHLSQAYDALLRLSSNLSIPVAHTMSGKGAIPCVHPLSAGLFGRYSRFANDLIVGSDCLLVVGCKLGEVATKRYSLIPNNVPLIHMDIVAEEFGRTALPHVMLWSDARLGLEDMSAALSEDAHRLTLARADYIAELPSRLAVWRAEASGRLNSMERPISVARLVKGLNDTMPDDAILVADGGFAAHWTGLLFDTKKAGRHYVADRGFASIGYGLPGGLGAALAAPNRSVVAVTGDGGFNMVLGELETARRAKANNLIIVVINNAASGYVKALQHAMYGQRYQSSDLIEMNYANIANVMGCQGIRLEDPNEIESALRRAFENRRQPTVIDVIATRDPSQMLPGIDSRTVQMKSGDRIA